MKRLLLAALLVCSSLASIAQTAYTRRHRTHHIPSEQGRVPPSYYCNTATRPAASAGPKVYICSGGSAYAYHSFDNCIGLNRCTHVVNAVTVAQAQSMGRRACKKCY